MAKDPIKEHLILMEGIDEALGGIKNLFNKHFGNKNNVTQPPQNAAPNPAPNPAPNANNQQPPSLINNPFSNPNALKNRRAFVDKMNAQYPKYTFRTLRIGNNWIWDTDARIFKKFAKILPNGDVQIVYDFNSDPLGALWLQSGIYEADNIYMQGNKVYFEGNWNGGDFGGVMAGNSTINSPGRISGGIFSTLNTNFKTNYKNFLYGGWGANDGILGFEYAKVNANLNELNLFALKKGQYVEFIDNGGANKYVLLVEKAPDLANMNLTLKNIGTNKVITIDWLNDARLNLQKYTFKLGSLIAIQNLLQTQVGVQSIRVFDTYNATHNVGNKYVTKPFIINNIKGLNIDAQLLIKPNQLKDYKDLETAINNGEFVNRLRDLNSAIRLGEIDGYGDYRLNNYLFPSEGFRAKKLSDDNKKLMEFFEKFRAVMINNIINPNTSKPDLNGQRNFVARLKNLIGIKKPANPNAATTAPVTAGKANVNGANASGSGPVTP
jgi:hypothetical protein